MTAEQILGRMLARDSMKKTLAAASGVA